MANTDFYLNNYRYFIASIHGRILIGFDTVSDCRDYIKFLLETDKKRNRRLRDRKLLRYLF